jgi:siroheme synthase-like protein
MLVDLVLDGKEAVVVGGGAEAELKVRKLLDGGARITVVAQSFTPRLRKLGLVVEEEEKKRGVRLIEKEPTGNALRAILRRTKPLLVFVSTGDEGLDKRVAREARSAGSLVCVVDRPKLNDLNMPAVAKLGDVRVAVSTQGMSPAMASILRKRIEKIITREDILQVRLQGKLREASKSRLPYPASRRDFVYRIIEDEEIKELLRRNRYREAERLAMKKMRSSRESGRKA